MDTYCMGLYMSCGLGAHPEQHLCLSEVAEAF